MSLEIFAARFKEAREKKNITIKALQPLVGASPSAMSGYATGKTLPPLDVAVKIAKELDVSLDWLCGNDEASAGSLVYDNCADVAIQLDAIENSFKHCFVTAEERRDPYDNPLFIVDVQIESEALYEYYHQLSATKEYFSKLPVNMRAGFAPYKAAMEQRLQDYLRTVPHRTTGLKKHPQETTATTFTPVETDESPW